MSNAKPIQRIGELAWNKATKVNGEFFALTYGAMVTQVQRKDLRSPQLNLRRVPQLIKDYEDLKAVNHQLDQMGYNIGIRLIDEFLAKSGVTSCTDFKETADVISKVAFKMFLGITTEVSNWNSENSVCSLLIHDNPLTEFVELPPSAYGELWYSNILCGVLRGALEMVQMRVEARFLKDVLQGDDVTEIRLELKGTIEETMGDEYKEE
ncbi:unnamed protein product [Albugo candida]|uniref:Trafficking protein particle complex subunit n=1 Tax=Albugo candida TaxID=65357 RepID=A0A024G2B4_9STRA|nr:unnamed protein product [Albugo candida]|eukprot:CCI40880.1 unnamed protein product [Albugo candida]